MVLDASHLTEEKMQPVAAEVGYSETAFVTGPIESEGSRVIPICYFAPEGEVDFCGHATIATAGAIGQLAGAGTYTLQTKVGPNEITARLEGDRAVGTLRSPDVDCFPITEDLLDQLLAALGWSAHDLDPDLPPAVGFGGNRHPILVTGEIHRLADFGAGAGGEFAGGRWCGVQDGRDRGEFETETVVQHERHTLGWCEPIQHHMQGDADSLSQGDVLGWVRHDLVRRDLSHGFGGP